jgi:flavin reductase (DIM6/NTAB) family NADH-FMN oxidoreductase RutF
MAEVNLDEWETARVYGFLMCAVVPRPIALVTTLSANGAVNAAPFSSFIALSPKPPMLGFVCGGWEGRQKDTLTNIARTKSFVVNVVCEAMAEAVEQCAAPLAPGESEIELSKLGTLPSLRVAAPRVAEAPIAFECRLRRLVGFGDAPDTLVAGRVVAAHAASGIVRDGRLDPDAWKPLARVGAGAFSRLSPPFRTGATPERPRTR